jgi:DNA-directed RNA polymerase subunit N (RpoN/RPB10)
MTARIRCVPKICTCGRKLAKHQGEIELRIQREEKIMEILDSLGIYKICCRANIVSPPTFPIIDSNSGSITIEEKNSTIDVPTYKPGNIVKLENTHVSMPY